MTTSDTAPCDAITCDADRHVDVPADPVWARRMVTVGMTLVNVSMLLLAALSIAKVVLR